MISPFYLNGVPIRGSLRRCLAPSAANRHPGKNTYLIQPVIQFWEIKNVRSRFSKSNYTDRLTKLAIDLYNVYCSDIDFPK